jgi:hypothetical protein
MIGPLLIAAGIGIFALTTGSSDAQARVRPQRSGRGVVKFTERAVFWRRNPKTGKPEYRIEIVESPADLAREAGARLGRGRSIPLDTFTLATLIASESSKPEEKIAIAHATRNKARGLGIGIYRLLTAKYGNVFGSQHGRYASTRVPPSAMDIQIAEAVQGGQIPDPSRGQAKHWFAPRAQTSLTKKNAAGYGKTAEALSKSWSDKGMKPLDVPGINPNSLRLWAA